MGTTRIIGAGPDTCRVVWAGAMMPGGAMPQTRDMMGRRRDRQRDAYGLKYGRLLKTDRVVAVCGNPRCCDFRHLFAVPAPKVPRASPPGTEAAVAHPVGPA